MLLVGGSNDFGLQIYQEENNNNNTKFVLKNILQFEDKGKFKYNSTIVTGKYIFVKGYQ